MFHLTEGILGDFLVAETSGQSGYLLSKSRQLF